MEVEDLRVAVERLFHEVDRELGHLGEELPRLRPRGYREGKEIWKSKDGGS